VDGHVRALASDSIRERGGAEAELCDLGFAAEDALWTALDSADAEVAGRAAGLLRRLYTLPSEPPPVGPPPALRDKTVTFAADGPAHDLVRSLAQEAGASLVFDLRAGIDPTSVPFKVSNLNAAVALKLLLAQFALESVTLDDAVLVTSPKPSVRTSYPRPPFWMDPAEAQKIESAMKDLTSEDPATQDRARADLLALAEPAIGPLLEAATLPGSSSVHARFRGVTKEIIDRLELWFFEEPSGADLQTLAEAQRKLLETRVDLDASGWDIERVLDSASARCEARQRPLGPLHVYAHGIKVGTLLKVVTRPCGLDFYFEGDKVIIDTAAQVRAAVER
jgi:hypothetical protein